MDATVKWNARQQRRNYPFIHRYQRDWLSAILYEAAQFSEYCNKRFQAFSLERGPGVFSNWRRVAVAREDRSCQPHRQREYYPFITSGETTKNLGQILFGADLCLQCWEILKNMRTSSLVYSKTAPRRRRAIFVRAHFCISRFINNLRSASRG